MDVISTSAAPVPTPRSPADEAVQKTHDTCKQLIRHMHGWVHDMETACENGDIHRLLALSAALGENNSYLAGIADKVARC